jgi:hypothetical protein
LRHLLVLRVQNKLLIILFITYLLTKQQKQMKKLFTLLTLALLSIGTAWAGDVYNVDFNGGGKTQSTADYFTISGSTNNGYNKGKYNGTSYTHALKMESATTITFTNAATATLRIIQATDKKGTAQTNGLTIDGTAYKYDNAIVTTPSDANNANIRIYTLTDMAAGAHTIKREGGESGVYRIEVEYTGAVMTQLSTPAITYDKATGTVTIGAVTNATKVTYTTDGSAPTASSDTYSAPFDAADGTTVKAIAIGDNVSYINSDIASETVLLTGITIANPTVNQHNGTVAITCASPSATIEYSTDGGANWTTYVRAFTLTSNTALKARASRTGCTTSAVVDADITAVPANVKTKTIVMGFGAFEGSGKVLTGRTDDVANGYTLTMLTDQDKSWSGRNTINIASIGEERTTICGSNGVQCKLDLPTGVKATKLTLYSYVNSATSDTKSAWKEVNGENLNSVLNDVPMGAFTDIADYQTNPDIRIFPLDEVTGSITFTNGGIQTCFVIELDVIEPEISATIDPTYGWATLVTPVALDFTGISDAKAYIVTGHSGNTVATTQMTGTVPANTPLLLEGVTTAIPVAASSTTDVSANLLKAGTGAAVSTESGKTKYALSAEGGVATFKKIVEDTTIPTDKAYLEFNEVISAPELNFNFGNPTGIQSITSAVNKGEGIVFDLQGRKVAQPAKGLYIVNGKKVVIK